MDYQVYISTPMNTPLSASRQTPLELTRGIIRGGWIYFPPGPAGKLHCQVWRADTQIAPANRGASFNLDDAVLPLHIEQALFEPPFDVWIRTWNTSTEYAHALNICLFLQECISKTYTRLMSTADIAAERLIREVKARL
jgi:hypothetical protein